MGFPPALSFLGMIPFAGLVVLYCVAFAEWKGVGGGDARLP
jgi:hypothetical protein